MSGIEKLEDFIASINSMKKDFIEEGKMNDEEEIYSERKYIVLIIYDIVSNKHRVKMAKLLSGYGTRVQKSAFEARLNKKQYARLLRDIKSLLNEEDNVRIYKFTAMRKSRLLGRKIMRLLRM